MRTTVKFIYEDMDRHGNVRVYVRYRRRKIRLYAKVGTPEFWTAYHAAVEALGAAAAESKRAADQSHMPRQPASLAWLCQRYFESAEFKQLNQRTRYVRRGILDRACALENDGDGPFRRLEARHIRARRDQLADRPEAANAYVKALRQVFEWARSAELVEHNPARDVPYLASTNPDGIHSWTIEETELFEKRHPLGTKAHLALALMLYTGVRRSDVVQLGRQMERAGALHFTETKGRGRTVKAHVIPITAPLRAAIDAAPSGHMTYLITEFGKPFTANGFGNWFRRRCNEAGLRHCSAHGLRKAGAARLAELGATEHQLMALFGWETTKQAAHYTRKANRQRMESEAARLLGAETGLSSESSDEADKGSARKH